MGDSPILWWLAGTLVIVAVVAWHRMQAAPKITVEIRVPMSLYRAVQRPAFFYAVGALTGVSITFSPFALYWFGRSGAFDWRVIACFVVTYLVPSVYMGLGVPVMQHAWNSRKAG